MSEQYIQYGAEVSLFSGKTRAYMRYKAIPFTETLATANVVNHLLYPNTGMRMIPVVKAPDGEFLQDTTTIIDTLEKRFPQHSVYPESPTQKLIAMLLELYADEWLLLPAMHYRWHYKRSHLWFILNEFGASAMPGWPKALQPFAGLLPAFYFGKMYKPVLGISRKNRAAVEHWYEAFLGFFNTHLEQHAYLLGGRPSIADFGFIGPLYAHLYRDPYSGRLMKRLAPNVLNWVERMMRGDAPVGDFVADDQIPETLLPILSHMLNTQYPVLRESVKRVAKKAKENPEQRLPRFLGKMTYQLSDIEEQRYVNSYAQWMLQRPIHHYQNLDGVSRQQVDDWLAANSMQALVDIDISQWIEKRENKLFPAQPVLGGSRPDGS